MHYEAWEESVQLIDHQVHRPYPMHDTDTYQ